MSFRPADNRGIDDKLFTILCDVWHNTPSLQTLGLNLTFLGPGKAGIQMTASPAYATVRGRLHGGITSALLDTAMGWAILTRGYNCVTTGMYTNFLVPVFEGTELKAEGEIIHLDHRRAVAEAALLDWQDQLMATSRATFAVRPMKSREEW